MISRNDFFQSLWDLPEFVIKVLMCGYPTKGRGRNIGNLLRPENFDSFIDKHLTTEKKNNISRKAVIELL